MPRNKQQSTKEIVTKIHKDIEGLTHDIHTLEAMAKKFIEVALEVRDLKEQLSQTNYRMKESFVCKFYETHCNHECKLETLIDNERN